MSDRPVTEPEVESKAQELAEERGLNWNALPVGNYPAGPSDRGATKQYFRAIAQALRGKAILQAMISQGSSAKN